jgi:hypothetical protein
MFDDCKRNTEFTTMNMPVAFNHGIYTAIFMVKTEYEVHDICMSRYTEAVPARG